MREKKHFIGVSMYLEVESAHLCHYFYFSYWRRDRHVTWSSQPPEGSAACSAKGLPSFLSYSLKTLNRVRSRELNPRPPTLQSSARLTQLILGGLIINENRSLPCYSFNATGSPFYDFILYFLKWSWSVCHFPNQVKKDLQKKTILRKV